MSIKNQQRSLSVSRQFYERMDLLPSKYKDILWDSPTMPITEDLDILWEMAQKDGSLDDVISRANNIKKETKKETPRERRSRLFWEKHQRSYYINRPIYGNPRLRDDCHGNLIRRLISEEELEALMAKRKEADDIRNAWVRPIVGYEKVLVKPKKDVGDKILPDKPIPETPLLKLMHNAGGRN